MKTEKMKINNKITFIISFVSFIGFSSNTIMGHGIALENKTSNITFNLRIEGALSGCGSKNWTGSLYPGQKIEELDFGTCGHGEYVACWQDFSISVINIEKKETTIKIPVEIPTPVCGAITVTFEGMENSTDVKLNWQGGGFKGSKDLKPAEYQ
jgi:hypothetical protein